MNERIRQLAEQAGFKVNWQHEDVQAIKMARFEKFAELIVQECFVKLTPYLDDQFIDDIESELKEHFGVEE